MHTHWRGNISRKYRNKAVQKQKEKRGHPPPAIAGAFNTNLFTSKGASQGDRWVGRHLPTAWIRFLILKSMPGNRVEIFNQHFHSGKWPTLADETYYIYVCILIVLWVRLINQSWWDLLIRSCSAREPMLQPVSTHSTIVISRFVVGLDPLKIAVNNMSYGLNWLS